MAAIIKFAFFVAAESEVMSRLKEIQLTIIGPAKKIMTAGSYGCSGVTLPKDKTNKIAKNPEYTIATMRFAVRIV